MQEPENDPENGAHLTASALLDHHSYEMYARLRTTQPVYRAPLADGRGCWWITGFSPGSTMLRDHHHFRNTIFPDPTGDLPGTENFLNRHLLHLDPPDHTRVRKTIAPFFTPRAIESFRSGISRIADHLLDTIEQRQSSSLPGTFDLLADFARPLTIAAMATALGIPDPEQTQVHAWSLAAGHAASGLAHDSTQSFDSLLAAIRQMSQAAPHADHSPPLIDHLMHHPDLTESERLSMVGLLLIGSYSTTVDLIGNGLLALFQHPDQLAQLQHQPAMLPLAIEEILRFRSPVEMTLPRQVHATTPFGDKMLGRGDQVIAILAAANRDAAQYPDQPDNFRIDRSPGRHLAFGTGIHTCPGAPLARLEAEIAFRTLFRRLPNLQLAHPEQPPSWRPIGLSRGLTHLLVTC